MESMEIRVRIGVIKQSEVNTGRGAIRSRNRLLQEKRHGGIEEKSIAFSAILARKFRKKRQNTR